uniref:Uncharacterized protein n=1 Tax=Rhizophora mucronata TaxID=61149 RepID=A0A2P2IIB1_RHIMU
MQLWYLEKRLSGVYCTNIFFLFMSQLCIPETACSDRAGEWPFLQSLLPYLRRVKARENC